MTSLRFLAVAMVVSVAVLLCPATLRGLADPFPVEAVPQYVSANATDTPTPNVYLAEYLKSTEQMRAQATADSAAVQVAAAKAAQAATAQAERMEIIKVTQAEQARQDAISRATMQAGELYARQTASEQSRRDQLSATGTALAIQIEQAGVVATADAATSTAAAMQRNEISTREAQRIADQLEATVNAAAAIRQAENAEAWNAILRGTCIGTLVILAIAAMAAIALAANFAAHRTAAMREMATAQAARQYVVALGGGTAIIAPALGTGNKAQSDALGQATKPGAGDYQSADSDVLADDLYMPPATSTPKQGKEVEPNIRRAKEFISAAIEIVGDTSATLPRYDKFPEPFGNGDAWTTVTDWLQAGRYIEKRQGARTVVNPEIGNLGNLLHVLITGYLPDAPTPMVEAVDVLREQS